VIGQVKQYSGSIPVAALREFIGAVETAFGTKLFGEIYTRHSPVILQFVTTGELTEAGRKVAETCSIHVITKRHLINMGILKTKEEIK
jgi:restriction endonuclease Mrr